MYHLLELFNTLQGEGSTQGLPVTLLRFLGAI
jgi:organic radical activating enzyme